MLLVSHVLDPWPAEIHFYATRYFPVPVMVVTVDNERRWAIVDGGFVGAYDLGE